jgi:murein DD-endopeptidase MepM/ murein hydrolase activator NlpD
MILCPIQSPVRITQHFASNPATYKKFGLKAHAGIDLTGPRPSELVPVYAPLDGTIYEVGNQGDDEGYGKYIRLRTAPNVKGIRREIVLGHFSRIDVEPGDEVSLGDPVGMMGSTGFSTAPHVHIGLRKIAADGSVMDATNGYAGYLDIEPYLLFWGDPKALKLARYPNG